MMACSSFPSWAFLTALVSFLIEGIAGSIVERMKVAIGVPVIWLNSISASKSSSLKVTCTRLPLFDIDGLPCLFLVSMRDTLHIQNIIATNKILLLHPDAIRPCLTYTFNSPRGRSFVRFGCLVDCVMKKPPRNDRKWSGEARHALRSCRDGERLGRLIAGNPGYPC